VKLTSSGTCGRAVITPAVPVTGWQVYSGKIYVAAVSTQVTQVIADGQFLGEAHYPNASDEKQWLQPSSVSATSMTFSGLPNNDIVGARATYRGPYPYAIGTRKIASYNGSTMALPANTDVDLNCEDTAFGKFYLEGKLWMLDSPGEWAWSNGKLYVWMPDGLAPGSRVLAAPNVRSVIDARATTQLTIDNVRIVGGWIGVDASFHNTYGRASKSLHIVNSEISFSNWSGIYATDATSLKVENSDVIGSLHTGLYARYGSTGTIVTGSRFTDVNTKGMHKGSDGTIYLNSDNGASVTNNVITNSGKSGIFLGASVNSLAKGNTVNGACKVHGDCGGIYTINRSQETSNLNTRIESNAVTGVSGPAVRPGSTDPERYAIYLDDYSAGVTVINNSVTNSSTAVLLHGAYNNTFSGNSFSGSVLRHVAFSESGLNSGSVQKNTFSNNTLIGPVLGYYLHIANPANGAVYIGNKYLNYGSSPIGNPAGLPY
jgi:parallel beta-helix repeat protein